MGFEIGFSHSYANLPEQFYQSCLPTPVANPQLIALNSPLRDALGLTLPADANQLAQCFSGNQLPTDAQPIAMAYAGHQFGGFSPQLGDGRAILLGEWEDVQGERWDLQLKGAGPTPFSRGGDGRAPLGPVLREYVVSEAMHALGVSTTRALAAVTTGQSVYRDRPLPGAVLCRVARSHIRVGTFEFFAARGDMDSVRLLADYVIERHYPELIPLAGGERYLGLLHAVIKRQAQLVARWMSLGFIHGVMNTDNMTVSGDTIDYGPCAFMDAYNPDTVFSSIDTGGRYAYRRQPVLAQWNLARLAETLLPLLDSDEPSAIALATKAIEDFMARYQQDWLDCMAAKLGIDTPKDDDQALVDDLLALMAKQQVDFTLLFRALGASAGSSEGQPARAFFPTAAGWEAWFERWQQRLAKTGEPFSEIKARMDSVNPAVIPRNHAVERMIADAIERQDFSTFERLFQRLQHPFVSLPDDEGWLGPPAPEERVYQTFCGT